MVSSQQRLPIKQRLLIKKIEPLYSFKPNLIKIVLNDFNVFKIYIDLEKSFIFAFILFKKYFYIK
jgi:hypothetical protein